MRRDWSKARAKVDREGCCRVCGTTARRIEAAHIVGREHDDKVVVPIRIVPLCGPATDTTTCHGKQHARRLDLLAYLSVPEQAQAVFDAGGISQAYDLLAPSESPRRVRGADRLPMPGDDRGI